MSRGRLPQLLIILGMIIQFLMASTAWSAESGLGRGGQGALRALVSGLQGQGVVFADDPSKGTAVYFHDLIGLGDQVVTDAHSVMDVLVGRHVLVTIYEKSRARFLIETPGRIVVQLLNGEIRIAAARNDQVMVVRTPSATTFSYGALMHARVLQYTRAVHDNLSDSAAHPARTAAVAQNDRPSQVEGFHVVEGMVQVQPSLPGYTSRTLQAGQSLRIHAGRADGTEVELSQPALFPLPATGAHASTAPRAIQHLIAREQAQAEELQRALLGGSGVTEAFDPKLDFRNVILSTTFSGQSVNAPAQNGPQGPVNVSGPTAIGGVTTSIPSAAPPMPNSAMAGVSSVSQPAVISFSPSGVVINPLSTPVIQPLPTGVGSTGSPSTSQPIPQPAQSPPSLPNLLGTLDILQFDKGKAFKDKPDKVDRPARSIRR